MLEINVKIEFPGFSLDVTENLESFHTIALFGPSGAGKSTMLRIVAGLEKNAQGLIRFGDEIWQDSTHKILMPAFKRGAILVFQDSRLFSHMNTKENLHYGLKRNHERVGPHWEDVIKTLQLELLLNRQINTLSGGEKQRVALGRALLAAPKLLLLDEPMSALDNARRDELLPKIKQLIDQYKIPVICVTHNPDELRLLGSDALKMSKGKIISHSWDRILGQGISAKYIGSIGNGLSECKIGSDIIHVEIKKKLEIDSVIEVNIDSQNVLLSTKQNESVYSFGQIRTELLFVDKLDDGLGRELILQLNGSKISYYLEDFRIIPDSLNVGQPIYLVMTKPAVYIK